MRNTSQTIGGYRYVARQIIDEAAGRARLRYITDVPGQTAVYQIKLQEAQALMVNPTGTPGPHLIAEAERRGTTPTSVANVVVTLAGLWNGVKSPAIEGARLAGKDAVNSVTGVDDETTRAAIESARDAAIAELNLL